MTTVAMEQFSAVLQDITKRLERLEQKIDEAALPPRAFPILEAARLLSVGETKMRQLLAEKKIRTVPIGDSDMVPMSEIVRVTSVTTTPRAAPTIRPAKSHPAKAGWKSDLAKLDAAVKKKKRR